jgi:hypothetical protein
MANAISRKVIAFYFARPWSRPSPSLSDEDQAWLLHEAALRLRALGRLAEAVEPTRAAVNAAVEHEIWREAANGANNLSELKLTCGEVAEASHVAEQAVTFVDRSQDGFLLMGIRTTLADTLHHAGCRAQARRRFEEAETMQAEQHPQHPWCAWINRQRAEYERDLHRRSSDPR